MFSIFCFLIGMIAGWFLHEYHPDFLERLKQRFGGK